MNSKYNFLFLLLLSLDAVGHLTGLSLERHCACHTDSGHYTFPFKAFSPRRLVMAGANCAIKLRILKGIGLFFLEYILQVLFIVSVSFTLFLTCFISDFQQLILTTFSSVAVAWTMHVLQNEAHDFSHLIKPFPIVVGHLFSYLFNPIWIPPPQFFCVWKGSVVSLSQGEGHLLLF